MINIHSYFSFFMIHARAFLQNPKQSDVWEFCSGNVKNFYCLPSIYSGSLFTPGKTRTLYSLHMKLFMQSCFIAVSSILMLNSVPGVCAAKLSHSLDAAEMAHYEMFHQYKPALPWYCSRSTLSVTGLSNFNNERVHMNILWQIAFGVFWIWAWLFL